MEEELNENDLEDRMYAMLHHVDASQSNVTEHSQNNDALRIVESTPNSTVRRYWRPDAAPARGPSAPLPADSSPFVSTTPRDGKTKPKEEEHNTPVSEPIIDNLFQSNPSQNLKTSIEFLDDENDNQVLELVTSDEDEVIEVALPPKPTITIESSDEEVDVTEVSPSKKSIAYTIEIRHNREREVSASPVPSVVSSVSDDFIRGDCIALNISSKRSHSHSFDFRLHGSDVLVQDTPSKKKKRKKNKENNTTTTSMVVTSTPAKTTGANQTEECFATPRSRSSKKKKIQSNALRKKSVPQMDIFDSDSNQSIDTNKKQTSYVVSDKSFPSIDVYESDSSQPESITNVSVLSQRKSNNDEIRSSESSDSDLMKTVPDPTKSMRHRTMEHDDNSDTIDLTDKVVVNESRTADKSIEENFVMANVTGFDQCNDNGDNNRTNSDPGQFGSTKIPAILNEDLDFDNLKGTDKFCSTRKFSVATLRAEMEKFYNESWGGENFNHREIQKRMSKDKSLWRIDPRDRMPAMATKKKTVCLHCGRAGHRDERCWQRVPACHMCGARGHREPRCPRKLCMNCGAPNEMYSSSCRQCRGWRAAVCAACGQRGHPRPACPDLWRRYHSTVDAAAPPQPAPLRAPPQQHCSGCARRGHLVHECRLALPFSAFALTSPAVADYSPLYPAPATPAPRDRAPAAAAPSKRRSQSPAAAAAPAKRRAPSAEFEEDGARPPSRAQRKLSAGKEADAAPEPDSTGSPAGNRDERGRVIQDSAVSATSDAVTTARLYVRDELRAALRAAAGRAWLRAAAARLAVRVAPAPAALAVTGTPPQQQAFQAELRGWAAASRPPENDAGAAGSSAHDLPKNRINLIGKLSKALDSLKEDLGDPRAIYEELTYLRKRHSKLLQRREVSSAQLARSRHALNAALRRLNALLLGQAGLAGGAAHVRSLAALRAQLAALRLPSAPPELRAQAGLHYAGVFSAQARDDYAALLDAYYAAPAAPRAAMLKRKKKKKGKTPKEGPAAAMAEDARPASAPPAENGAPPVPPVGDGGPPAPPAGDGAPPETGKPSPRGPSSKKTIRNLELIHRQLLKADLVDPDLKRKRLRFVRVLHSQIASLKKSEKISSKAIKKMKKFQHEARTFLKNVKKNA